MKTVRKNSKKRQAILEAIRNTDTHPNAEWLYTQLKPAYPDLSVGTVYRNLNIFKEEGLIISLGTVAGQERFDGDLHPHAHFVCDKCGAVVDLDLPAEDLDAYVRLGYDAGLEVRRSQLMLWGLCKNCAENGE